MAKRILIWFMLVAAGFAAEVVPVMEINGVRYADVKFGPVNQDKIVVYHSHGIMTVPISSLPEEYQQRFAAKSVPQEIKEPPKPAAPAPSATLEAMRAKKSEPAAAGNSEWASYNRDRASIVVLDGKLVDKFTLTPLVGFLAAERAKITDGTKAYTGAQLDLAVHKEANGKVADAMELRPALWRRTDEHVFLLNYKPQTLLGVLMKVYVVEIDPIDQWRTFKVGTEPSFEEWKSLPREIKEWARRLPSGPLESNQN